MVKVELRVRGVKRTTAKFKEISATLRSQKFSNATVNYGYRQALKLAPEYSGATKKALMRIRGPKSGKLRLTQPANTDRPYHLWMHRLGQYDISDHIKSGDPIFMFTTRDLMEKHVLELIRKELNKKTK
jgi:hypothetical protein